MTKQEFTVEGGGFFPLDMLRYDSCYPVTAEDVSKIDTSILQEMRQVRLARVVRNKNHEPTLDRWQSFGWIIVPGSLKLYTL